MLIPQHGTRIGESFCQSTHLNESSNEPDFSKQCERTGHLGWTDSLEWIRLSNATCGRQNLLSGTDSLE